MSQAAIFHHLYVGRYTKRQWGTRPLGIPTVADRIAQMVAKRYLEPILEKYFHPDSYGYRPEKSALEAIGVARQRAGDTTGFLTSTSKASLTNRP